MLRKKEKKNVLPFTSSDVGGLLIGHTDVLSRTGEQRGQMEEPGPKEVLPDIMDPRLVQKTIRIFLSSTFTDTRVDRNKLMEDVFEPVRDLCQQHGIAFEVVDLRWGKNANFAMKQILITVNAA